MEAVADQIAQELVAWQFALDVVAVGQIPGLAHAVAKHHLLEALVGGRVLQDRQPRRQARPGAEQVQGSARMQVGNQQGAGGFAPDQHGIAGLDMLQARGQRPVRHLDAEELELLIPIRAGDRVRAHQRLALHLQPDHHELAVFETEAVVAGEGEAEVGIGPVADVEHRFGAEGGGHAVGVVGRERGDFTPQCSKLPVRPANRARVKPGSTRGGPCYRHVGAIGHALDDRAFDPVLGRLRGDSAGRRDRDAGGCASVSRFATQPAIRC